MGGQQCKSVLFTRAENVTELSFNFSLVFCISTGGYHRKESNSGVSVLSKSFVTYFVLYNLLCPIFVFEHIPFQNKAVGYKKPFDPVIGQIIEMC